MSACFTDGTEAGSLAGQPRTRPRCQDGELRGILRATAELVISGDGQDAAGVGMFRHGVAAAAKSTT